MHICNMGSSWNLVKKSIYFTVILSCDMVTGKKEAFRACFCQTLLMYIHLHATAVVL